MTGIDGAVGRDQQSAGASPRVWGDEEPVAPPEGDAPPAAQPSGGQGIFGDLEVGLVDLLCVGPILLASLWALFGTPISPGLIDTHPVLLSALRGSLSAMIATGSFARVGTLPLWQAILAPLPILVWVDPFYYWAGRRYGRLLLDYYKRQSPRMDRRIERAELSFARFGLWAILVNPFLPFAPFLFLAAGETRMNFWKFFGVDILANLIYIGLVVSLGWFIGQRGVDIAQTIGHYGIILTVVLVVGVIVVAWRQSAASARAR
jgi:membrane protein DedA with SNARE-associated domain